MEKLAKDTVTIVFLCVRHKEAQLKPFPPDETSEFATKFNFLKWYFDKSDFAMERQLLRKGLIKLKKS